MEMYDPEAESPKAKQQGLELDLQKQTKTYKAPRPILEGVLNGQPEQNIMRGGRAPEVEEDEARGGSKCGGRLRAAVRRPERVQAHFGRLGALTRIAGLRLQHRVLVHRQRLCHRHHLHARLPALAAACVGNGSVGLESSSLVQR